MPRRSRDKKKGKQRASPAGATPPGVDRLRQWLPPVLIVAAGLLVYWNSFHGVFVFDDNRHIVENPRLRELWPLDRLLAGRRPVLDFTLALNYAVHGLAVWGFHLVNVTIHIVAGLVLYGVVRRTTALPAIRERYGEVSPFLTMLVALLWLVHPLQTQSVTYIVQRGESLMGLFFLLTLYCVIRGAGSERPSPWYGLAVIASALGMGTKAVMVTVPVIVLSYDYTFLSGSFVKAMRARWPVYVGLGLTLLVPVWTGVAGGVLSTEARPGATVGLAFQDVSPLGYLATQPSVLLMYLRVSLWPHPLCLDYGWPIARHAADVVPYAVPVVALVLATVVGLTRRHWLGFVGAWFFVILSPTSSFIPIRDPLFEHRMYLPLAVVVAAAVFGSAWLLRRLSRAKAEPQTRHVLGATLAVLCVVALGARTVTRNRDYRSDLAMWESAVETRPQNARAHNALGIALNALGRYEEAIASYTRALELNPVYTEAQFNLASALMRAGNAPAAVEAFERTLRLQPDHVRAMVNMTQALYVTGRIDEAFAIVRKAIDLDPTSAQAHVNLGNLLSAQGDLEAAAAEFREAIRVDPADLNGYFNLGNTLRKQGRLAEAADALRQAVRVAPHEPRAHLMLAKVLQQLGQTDEAARAYRAASRLTRTGSTP